jgi:hypothetical protein
MPLEAPPPGAPPAALPTTEPDPPGAWLGPGYGFPARDCALLGVRMLDDMATGVVEMPWALLLWARRCVWLLGLVLVLLAVVLPLLLLRSVE